MVAVDTFFHVAAVSAAKHWLRSNSDAERKYQINTHKDAAGYPMVAAGKTGLYSGATRIRL